MTESEKGSNPRTCPPPLTHSFGRGNQPRKQKKQSSTCICFKNIYYDDFSSIFFHFVKLEDCYRKRRKIGIQRREEKKKNKTAPSFSS